MKKAKCFKCKRVLTYNSSFAGKGEYVKNKRDSDGLDIFESNQTLSLVKTVDIYGREIDNNKQSQVVIYIYSNGTINKVYRF